MAVLCSTCTEHVPSHSLTINSPFPQHSSPSSLSFLISLSSLQSSNCSVQIMHNDAFAASHGEFSASDAAMSSSIRSKYQPNSASYTSVEDSQPASQSTINEIIYQSRLILEHRDLINRHTLCLNRLCEATREAEALRQENASLCSLNRELNENLSLMIQAAVQNRISSDDFVNRFHGLCMGDEGGVGRAWDEVSSDLDESPTSVMESPKEEVAGLQRVYLPKSISVRSNGYLKISQPGATQGGQTQTQNLTNPLISTMQQQKVIVNGGKKEEDALELEVYNQGMWKTELCNKWQETGACPYGDHCQFAHGMEELRPVIRHPRYKTEVCRMVLAGDACPYGHRCHFRHALTDQERRG